MDKTSNKILAVLLVVVLFGVLAKMLYWSFAPQITTFAALGVSVILLIKTFTSAANSSVKKAMYFILGLSFLLSALSAFFGDFQSALLSIGGVCFLVFLVFAVIDHFRSTEANKHKKYTLLLVALALFGISYLLKLTQFQFADYALILSFIAAGIWVIKLLFAHKPAGG